MQCYKCQYKWQDTPKTITGLCPACGTNLLKSLTYDSKKIDTEYKLQYIVQFFGYDILQHRHLINGIIYDLFSHNMRLREQIITSINLKIPDRLNDIKFDSDIFMSISSLKEFLLNKTSMSNMEATEILYDWKFAIPQ